MKSIARIAIGGKSERTDEGVVKERGCKGLGGGREGGGWGVGGGE
jgi:hypothetical protein